MGYSMKPGSKEKNTPSNFKEKDAKRMSASTQFPASDMEVTITAKKKTISRGQAAPAGDSKTGRKVKEMKKERKFDDVALSKKEKEGKKGAKYAKKKTYSIQNVSFKK